MIKTQLSLVDSFTGPIMHMQAAMQSMVRTCQNLHEASGRSVNAEALQHAQAELALTDQSMQALKKSMEKAENKNTEMSQNMAQGNSKILSGVKRLVAAYASVQTVQSMIQKSDALTQTTARVNLMNDGLQTTNELQQYIYNSANASRGSYLDTANAVAKMGNNAASAFKSSKEIVDFMEQVNKNFAIGGAGAQEQSNAMLQLSQAMAAGALRGDELNSVLEGAPEIARLIEKNMGWASGSIKQYAEQGKVSAKVVKDALLDQAEETNKKFESMPKTWSQLWTMGSNKMIQAFTPALDKINELANDKSTTEAIDELIDVFGKFCSTAVSGLGLVARIGHTAFSFWGKHKTTIIQITKAVLLCYAAYKTFNLVSTAAVGIQKIAAVVSAARKVGIRNEIAALYAQATATTAATSAQTAMNSAMLASPITWIVIALVAVIWAIHEIVKAGNEYLGWHTSTLGVITGGIASAGAFVWNLVLAVFDLVLGIVSALINRFIIFTNFLANCFKDPIGSIIHLFGDLGDYALGILQSIAGALDKLFGSSFSSTIQGWRNNLSSSVDKVAATYGNGKYKKKYKSVNLTSDGLNRIKYSKAFEKGNNWGTDMTKKAENMKNKFLGNDKKISTTKATNALANYGKGTAASDAAKKTAKNTGKTANNTKAIKDSLDITSEQVKYIKDYAARKAVNRYTTASIKVDMINHNTVNNKQDLDGITTTLAKQIKKEMAAVAGGAF